MVNAILVPHVRGYDIISVTGELIERIEPVARPHTSDSARRWYPEEEPVLTN